MGFYEGKYTPFINWKWKRFGDRTAIEVIDFMGEHPNAEFYIGTDSQNYSRKGKKYCTFTTCLVAYTLGLGGCAILSSERTERISNLRQRLMIEAFRSLEVGWFLNGKIDPAKIITIHLDVNPNLKYKSSKYLPELVGMVAAQGFHCEHKPHSWAATWAADKRC